MPEVLSFHASVPKDMIIYTVPGICHGTNAIVIFHFGLILPFYHPNSTKNENFKKKKKKKKSGASKIIIMMYSS